MESNNADKTNLDKLNEVKAKLVIGGLLTTWDSRLPCSIPGNLT